MAKSIRPGKCRLISSTAALGSGKRSMDSSMASSISWAVVCCRRPAGESGGRRSAEPGGFGQDLQQALASLRGQLVDDLDPVLAVQRLDEALEQHGPSLPDHEHLVFRLGRDQQVGRGLDLVVGDELLEVGDELVAG